MTRSASWVAYFYEFEEAHIGAECGLPFVALLNAHIVVTPADVQLRKVASTLKLVEELLDER